MDNTAFAAVTHGLGSHCRNLASAHQTEEGSVRSTNVFPLQSSFGFSNFVTYLNQPLISWKHPRARRLLTKKPYKRQRINTQQNQNQLLSPSSSSSYFHQISKKMSQFSEQYSGRQGQEPKRSKKPTKHKKEPVKITYISSPTMIKATNASEFRAIVQELTGKDSKVEDPFDAYSMISNEEASQVPHYGTPQFNVAGVHDIFPNNTPFLQTEDGFFWGDVSEMFFEFRSPCVFL
ncbi:hypothetical protein POTOM_045173 [Populus tomentosa]|uniref:VQ domain-containing protein n=1 Tax=Populus tomentosa TaxID=118781 RepID=A0A8X8CDQ6_POPTO|nr:hypothetical protein POTOM_045173 [Populus tomentosa]